MSTSGLLKSPFFLYPLFCVGESLIAYVTSCANFAHVPNILLTMHILHIYRMWFTSVQNEYSTKANCTHNVRNTCSRFLYGIVPQIRTRRSVEHCTPHADGAQLHFTGLSYRFWNDKYLLLIICWQSMELLEYPVNQF